MDNEQTMAQATLTTSDQQDRTWPESLERKQSTRISIAKPEEHSTLPELGSGSAKSKLTAAGDTVSTNDNGSPLEPASPDPQSKPESQIMGSLTAEP